MDTHKCKLRHSNMVLFKEIQAISQLANPLTGATKHLILAYLSQDTTVRLMVILTLTNLAKVGESKVPPQKDSYNLSKNLSVK